MNGGIKLLDAQRNKNDEFYTPRQSVEWIFNNEIDKEQFRDKVIYCPADTENSEFVKYLIDNKLELNYKELIYTWDDMRDHLDLFDKADIIITNPPFSLVARFLYDTIRDKKFFIFTHLSVLTKNMIKDIIENKAKRLIPLNSCCSSFITDTGNITYIPIVFLTNLKTRPLKNLVLTKNFEDITPIYDENSPEDEKILFMNRIKNIPLDYKGIMEVPCSIFNENYLEKFEVISNAENYISDKRYGIFYTVSPIINSKEKYLKYLIKFKE